MKTKPRAKVYTATGNPEVHREILEKIVDNMVAQAKDDSALDQLTAHYREAKARADRGEIVIQFPLITAVGFGLYTRAGTDDGERYASLIDAGVPVKEALRIIGKRQETPPEPEPSPEPEAKKPVRKHHRWTKAELATLKSIIACDRYQGHKRKVDRIRYAMLLMRDRHSKAFDGVTESALKSQIDRIENPV